MPDVVANVVANRLRDFGVCNEMLRVELAV